MAKVSIFKIGKTTFLQLWCGRKIPWIVTSAVLILNFNCVYYSSIIKYSIDSRNRSRSTKFPDESECVNLSWEYFLCLVKASLKRAFHFLFGRLCFAAGLVRRPVSYRIHFSRGCDVERCILRRHIFFRGRLFTISPSDNSYGY